MNQFNLNVARVESMGLNDGPGIRYVIFLQGCHLRCIYCHNPEMLNETVTNENKTDQLLNVINYKEYFKDTGGVTISGGEPLLQAKELIKYFKYLKNNEINICIDTAGVGDPTYFDDILKYVDVVLFDVKGFDETYTKITRRKLDGKEFFSKCIDKGKRIIIRYVLVEGITDTTEQINKLIEFMNTNNLKEFNLLPFHSMAKQKYEEMNLENPLKNMKSYDPKKKQKLEQYIRENL